LTGIPIRAPRVTDSAWSGSRIPHEAWSQILRGLEGEKARGSAPFACLPWLCRCGVVILEHGADLLAQFGRLLVAIPAAPATEQAKRMKATQGTQLALSCSYEFTLILQVYFDTIQSLF